MKHMTTPNKIIMLHEYLDLVSYYQIHIPDIYNVIIPLNGL